jgi:hypothetical protein
MSIGVGGGLRMMRGVDVGMGEGKRGVGPVRETGETGGGDAKGSRRAVKSSEWRAPPDSWRA